MSLHAGSRSSLDGVNDFVTRTLSADHITPVRAYAALRAQSPGRSSFLFEASSAAGDERGRFSILGYRARAEATYPAGGDALALIARDVAKTEAPDDFAIRASQSLVGYISYDVGHVAHKVEPWPNEGDLARMMRDTTAVVFDSWEHTLTIAGRSNAAVDRCAWEMTHGPDMQSLSPLDAEGVPEHMDELMDDAAFVERARRVGRRIASGDASRVVLARGFRAPLRGADPFDVYRALRALSPSPYHFFFDFAESPMAEGVVIAGSSVEAAALLPDTSEGGDASGASASMHAALRESVPASAMTGAPRARATAIIRELETSPRGVYGGAVGYASPGGRVELAMATCAVVLKRGYLEVRGGAEIAEGSDPEGSAQESRRSARAALASIRAAQDLAAAREQAAHAAQEKG